MKFRMTSLLEHLYWVSRRAIGSRLSPTKNIQRIPGFVDSLHAQEYLPGQDSFDEKHLLDLKTLSPAEMKCIYSKTM
jgi:hypothetical protein